MFGVVVVVVILLSLLFFVRKKLSNDPLPIPFVKNGYLPIVGHLLPFLKDKSKFIFECQRFYGSRFVLEFVSQRMIFLLDPADWTNVTRNPNLSLPAKDFGRRIFGISRVFMDDDVMMNEVHRYFKSYLQHAEALSPLTSRFVKCVRETMMRDRGEIGVGQWKETGLLQLSHQMIFEASGRTLFGEMNPLELEKPFMIFDKYFHLFAAFLPAFVNELLLKRELAARAQMIAHFEAHPHSPDESDLAFHRATRILQAESRQVNDLGASQNSIFWASVGNTIPATFWALWYILRDRKALDKINEEIRTYLPPISLSDPNDKNFELWTAEAIGNCIYLDSAMNETLRFKGTPMVRKGCSQDTQVTLSNGTVLSLKAGDTIFLYSEAAHHNPNYFPDPETFQFDRFVGKTADAVKGFLPFGSGKSMCPGRHFARNEIKICTALILYNIEYEFLDKDAHVECQKSRVGFGIAPPEHDLPIRYRYRY